MPNMSKPTKITKCSCPWNSAKLVAELEANDARHFLKDGDFTDLTYRHRRKVVHHRECYDKMLEKLKATKTEEYGKRDDQLRCLLIELWRRYENDLRVNKYDADTKEIWFEECSGVNINLYYNTENESEPETEYKPDDEKKVSWHVAYHTIFHEFFHNIDAVAYTHSYTYREGNFERFKRSYQFESDSKAKEIFNKNCQFGEIIINDVRNLLAEEKKAAPNDYTRLREITHNTAKCEKSALYDIIGAVFYKGQYGCNPVSEKCEYEYWCDPLSKESKSEYLNCTYRIGEGCLPGNADNKCVYSYRCKYNPEELYDDCEAKNRAWCRKNKDCKYRIRCEFSTEHKAGCLKNKTYGHEKDYWLKQGKEGFPKLLAEETFAYMAAEAIVNPQAYNKMKKCLLESEKMFREILIKMSCEKERNEYWIQCETEQVTI